MTLSNRYSIYFISLPMQVPIMFDCVDNGMIFLAKYSIFPVYQSLKRDRGLSHFSMTSCLVFVKEF